MKPIKAVGIQYAALPYLIDGPQVRVLLITSRETRRWVIPKGWPMSGLKPQEAAAAEAAEEAGIIGEVEPTPIGSYRYLKQIKGKPGVAVQVIVFPFHVDDYHETWKEQGQRGYEWFRYQAAARRVAEPSLKRLIQEFGAARTPTLLAKSLRRYRTWRIARAH
ncbi:MAG TPA: NUDIX hydrolase [Caulobacteraceae bacterium]